jgi:hypothetical protein
LGIGLSKKAKSGNQRVIFDGPGRDFRFQVLETYSRRCVTINESSRSLAYSLKAADVVGFRKPILVRFDPVMIDLMPSVVEESTIGRFGRAVDRLPPAAYFVVGAILHSLGPSLAVLLFVHVEALGVGGLRIASAAVIFAIWRRPWRVWLDTSGARRLLFAGLGAVLALMNSLFYLAVERLLLSSVGAVEFLGIVILAALGAAPGATSRR